MGLVGERALLSCGVFVGPAPCRPHGHGCLGSTQHLLPQRTPRTHYYKSEQMQLFFFFPFTNDTLHPRPAGVGWGGNWLKVTVSKKGNDVYKMSTQERARAGGRDATLVGEHETGWELPHSCCCALSRGGGLWAVGAESGRPALACGRWGSSMASTSWGASRGSASRINGYISSLDAREPHQRGKLAGLGLAFPEALRGEGTVCASHLVSGPRVLPPRDDRKWVPMVGCGSWQQRGAQKGEGGGHD